VRQARGNRAGLHALERRIAADGSAVRLTMMKNGVRNIVIVEGVGFGLYLPGIELFLDFVLHEPVCHECQMFRSSPSVMFSCERRVGLPILANHSSSTAKNDILMFGSPCALSL
jgi:hypothetical protein